MDPIIADRTCSCCPRLIESGETYIVSWFKQHGSSGTEYNHTSCKYCGQHYVEVIRTGFANSAPYKLSGRVIRYRTSDGKPLEQLIRIKHGPLIHNKFDV